MSGYTFTRVWDVNNEMVVADTIEDAIRLYKLVRGENDITFIKAISVYGEDYDAIAKKQYYDG